MSSSLFSSLACPSPPQTSAAASVFRVNVGQVSVDETAKQQFNCDANLTTPKFPRHPSFCIPSAAESSPVSFPLHPFPASFFTPSLMRRFPLNLTHNWAMNAKADKDTWSSDSSPPPPPDQQQPTSSIFSFSQQKGPKQKRKLVTPTETTERVQCDLCTNTYKNRATLRKHKAAKHSDNNEVK